MGGRGGREVVRTTSILLQHPSMESGSRAGSGPCSDLIKVKMPFMCCLLSPLPAHVVLRNFNVRRALFDIAVGLGCQSLHFKMYSGSIIGSDPMYCATSVLTASLLCLSLLSASGVALEPVV